MITTITLRIEHIELPADEQAQLRQITNQLLGTTTAESDIARAQLMRVVRNFVGEADIQVTHAPGWVAGWNVPGYLPDDEPQLLESFHDACSYLVDELARAAQERRDESAQCGGERMISLNRQVREYEDAMEFVGERSREVSRGAEMRPFWIQCGNHAWWVARESQP